MDDWLLYAHNLRRPLPGTSMKKRQHICSACLDFDMRTISCSPNSMPTYQDQPARFRRSIDLLLQPILQAAEAGCQGCTTLRFAVGPKLDSLGLNAVIFIQDLKPYIYTLCASKEGDSRMDATTFQEFNIMWPQNQTDTYDGPWSLPRTMSISGYTGSEKAILRARSWLKRCETDHKSCITTKNARLPTRVIEILDIGKVRLHVSQDECAPYVCLSHCWGPNPSHIPRTLISNLQDRQTAIPWSLLTNSFRDAIIFTFRLGVRYIWIDSLCIVQDSVDDWRAEGSRMADIYESAYFTIAAASASSSEGGCFTTARPNHLSRYMTVTPTEPDEEPYQVHARSSLPHNTQYSSDLPLLRRGWIFQERQLSRRLLYFTSNELVWECRYGTWCECQPDSHTFFGDSQRIYKLDIGDFDAELKYLEQWHCIVSDYSRLSLTFSKDIFPALQGLAKRSSPMLGEYIAGLWERTLLYSLTWFLCLDDDRQERPQPWRAPTWSWASMNGAVAFLDFQGQLPQIFVSVVKLNIVPKGTDSTGELASALLELRGKCVGGILRYTYGEVEPHIEIPSDEHCPSRSIFPSWAYASETSETKHDRSEYTISTEEGGGMFLDYQVECPGGYHVPDGSEVLLLKTDETSPGFYDGKERRVQSWLVLRRLDTGVDHYERIGVLKLTRDGGHRAYMDELYEHRAQEMTVIIV